MTGLVLHAEDAPPATDGDGYRNITAKSGGPTILRVKDQPNPYRNVAAHTTSEKYSPMSLDFSRTSPMANKPFTTGDAGLSKKNDEERNFITKPYLGDGATTADALADKSYEKNSIKAAQGYDHGVPGLSKSFATSADGSVNKSALFASNTSEYQGRTALLGKDKVETSASQNLAPKPYLGPEASYVKHDLDETNQGLSRMTGLPNRPLTIDEVRGLINHETKPDTDAKPDAPSKPLNDPDYKPEPSRDDTPSPAPEPASPHGSAPVEDESQDAVPSPGTMAAHSAPPENSEPLPR